MIWKLRLSMISLSMLLMCITASAAEITVLSSVGMRSVLESLQPNFERATGNKLNITFGSAAPLKRQIEAGVGFDVAVLTPQMLADLATSGKVVVDSIASVAKTGVGIAARKDTALPAIHSAEQLKRALLAAKSVASSKEGQTGIVAAAVMEKLGITAQMQPRIMLATQPGGSITAVVDGSSELGFGLLSEIVPEPKVKLLGPMPGDLQSYVAFAAGVASNAADAAAARSLVEFMRSAVVQSTLAAKGMEGM
jgi:molybdate transport system substrate-binding protein